jgi:O-antigen/teichoic acid export membrane protein
MEYFPVIAPLMKQRIKRLVASPTIKVISGLAGGNLLATLIGVAGSLVQARYVTPDDLGYFRGFSIATGYAFFFHLGILDALQRLYPYYIGRGDKDKAIAVAEISQSWMVLITILVSGTFIVLALLSLANNNWRAMLGWLVQAVAMMGFIYGGYLSATYRSGHDFVSVAKGEVLSSITNLLTLPLFLFWPYIALAVRSCVGSLLNLCYLHFRRPLRLTWRLDRKELSALIKQGLPLFLASYGVATGWSVVETSIILKTQGTIPLGYWWISFMILEMANKIPQAIYAVYNPRVMTQIGQTRDVGECLRMLRKPMLLSIPAMLLMSGLGYLFLPYLVPILMPHYIEAIPAMSLMLLKLVFIPLVMPQTILIALGKVVHWNVSVYIGLGSFIALALLAVNKGFGLSGIIIASLLGQVLRILVLYLFVYINWFVNKENKPDKRKTIVNNKKTV